MDYQKALEYLELLRVCGSNIEQFDIDEETIINDLIELIKKERKRDINYYE